MERKGKENKREKDKGKKGETEKDKEELERRKE